MFSRKNNKNITPVLEVGVKRPKRMDEKQNIVDSRHVTTLVLQFIGQGVLIRKYDSGRVVNKFSLLGFFCFIILGTVYYFCAYKNFTENQTILRALYDTKLQNYGDDYEFAVTFLFSLFVTWKIPFAFRRETQIVQVLVDIDRALVNLGIKVEYKQESYNGIIIIVAETIAMTLRCIFSFGCLWQLNLPIPYNKLLNIIVADAVALIFASDYSYYMIALTYRFKLVNQVLSAIRDQSTIECKELFRGDASKAPRCLAIQYNIICSRISECSRIYSQLYRAVNMINESFGVTLFLIIFMSISYIILNMFYFMEATAAGLYNDFPRYLGLLVYLIWAVIYNIGVMFLNIMYSEVTVAEAKSTSLVVHEIMNAGVHPSVTNEAMQMSLQLLHQVPRFTAIGLFSLDYPLVLESFQFITTFLALLLQYAR